MRLAVLFLVALGCQGTAPESPERALSRRQEVCQPGPRDEGSRRFVLSPSAALEAAKRSRSGGLLLRRHPALVDELAIGLTHGFWDIRGPLGADGAVQITLCPETGRVLDARLRFQPESFQPTGLPQDRPRVYGNSSDVALAVDALTDVGRLDESVTSIHERGDGWEVVDTQNESIATIEGHRGAWVLVDDQRGELLLSNQEEARALGAAVLRILYGGQDPETQGPLVVERRGDAWLLEGFTLWTHDVGGIPYLSLRARDGAVLSVGHSK